MNNVNRDSKVSYINFVTDVSEERFELDGETLHYNDSIQDLEPALFWKKINISLGNTDWKFLCIAPGEKIDRERLELFAKLTIDISPSDLIQVKNIELKNLQELVDAKLPPLHVATCLGSIPLMEKVFNEGIDLNTVCSHNEKYSFNECAPLTMAFALNKLDVFQWLLDKGASFEFVHIDLLYVCYKNEEYRAFAPVLVKHQFLTKIKPFNSSLHEAAEKGDKGYFQFLFELGASSDLKIFGNTPLSSAIKHDQIELVAYLLSLNHKIQSAYLKYALKNPSMITLLLERGVSFSYTDLIEHLSNPSVLELLLKHCGQIEWESFSILTLQSVIDHPEVLNLFLKHIAHLDKQSFFNRFKLMGSGLEFIMGQSGIFERTLHILLDSGDFNINICDREGTPLFHELINSKKLLLIQKALADPLLDKTTLDRNGVSALQLAVCTDNVEIVQLLLTKGFDVNSSCASNISPLHIAADKGNAKMVILLLKHGADRKLRDVDNYTPAMHSLDYSESLIEMLIPEGSEMEIPSTTVHPLWKQSRLPRAFSFYEKLEPACKLKGKESNIIKLLAHIFELKGTVELIHSNEKNNTQLNLEGMGSNRWLYHKLKKLLIKLEKDSSFPSILCKTLIDLSSFFESVAIKKDRDFYERFHEGKPLAIETGYLKHNVVFFFQKMNVNEAIFGVINRQRPIQIFRMEPSALTEEMIAEIRSYQTRSSGGYDHLLSKLENLSKRDEELNKLAEKCPLKEQIVGNCVWASFEGALWLTIAHQCDCDKEGKDVLTANKLFANLMLEFKLHMSSKYFSSHRKEGNPYFPDMTLCNTIIEKVGSYSKQLQDDHKKLSDQFKAIPWKKTEDSKENNSSTLSYDLLRTKYYF